jgi:formylglycine-generating enzyme required for sulfatase activity
MKNDKRFKTLLKLSAYTLIAVLAACWSTASFSQNVEVNLNDTVKLEMVFVEGGTFIMGSDFGKKDAHPAHQVRLDDFYIGKFEFTQKQWIAVSGDNPSEIPCMKCPVNDFSWEQLMDFISKLNQQTGNTFRLPTEAEWEYAAQGGQLSKGYKYSGSNNIEEVAWLKPNGNDQQHEVGQLKPNELGLYDMNGNAWELCQDWYDKKFYQRSSRENPVNTEEAKYRVSRGASWMSPAHYCERHYRNTDHPHHKRGNGGFRLVMEP